MIIEPGQHWHKDDMPDEEPIPGVTEPNYDEHPDPNGYVDVPVDWKIPPVPNDDIPF